MPSIDQLESMKVFIAIVESGSFSAAARKLRLQQSTISRVIGGLEDEYNTVLLNRTTRKMTLTEAGHAYLSDSRRILAEVDELNIRMKRIREEPKGLLRLGLPTAFGKLIVVPTLSEFKRRFPDIMLEIHHDDRLVDIIAEGYDVVIRVGGSQDSLITSRKIALVRRGLFVAKSLLKKLGPVVSPQDLSRFPALLFDDRAPEVPKWTLSKGRNRVSVPIPSLTAVDQLDSLHTLLKEGLGVAYAPLFFMETAGTPIERVLPDWDVVGDLEASSGVYALFPGGSKVSAKVRVFVDFLVERLSRMNV
jgi:DNA-binding transcriptional LysR family regulator